MAQTNSSSATGGKGVLNSAHNALVFNRRIQVLADHLVAAIPDDGSVLDVGCGDGQVAVQLMARKPGLTISGVDILVRPQTHIPVTQYDGDRLPFDDDSFDYVTIVDVLHHTDDPGAVLKEAVRVSRKGVAIKDHLREGFLAGPILRAMDWVGNRGHDVVLPYNYLTHAEWAHTFATAGCEVASWREQLALYPAPISWICDRRLHFVALLVPRI